MLTKKRTKKKTGPSPQSYKESIARVTLLNGDVVDEKYDKYMTGRDLLNSICARLNIIEKDYFGFKYSTQKDPCCWLDTERPIYKFFKTDPCILQFAVKFYPPEPSDLLQDITRYHLCLQVRNDILEERLPGSFVTNALLGSYLVQSEIGDWNVRQHNDRRYLKGFKISPEQNAELEDKVMELHKTHKGQSPPEAELNYLENAKQLRMYGVHLHSARDYNGLDVKLGVCAYGVLLYRDRTRINRFAWTKILKISYESNNFYIKIRPIEFEPNESTICFKLANYQAAKNIWKLSVEHHKFFRKNASANDSIYKTMSFPRLKSGYRSSRLPNDNVKPNLQRSTSESKLHLRGIESEKDGQMGTKRHTDVLHLKILPDEDLFNKKKYEKKQIVTKNGSDSDSSQSYDEGDYDLDGVDLNSKNQSHNPNIQNRDIISVSTPFVEPNTPLIDKRNNILPSEVKSALNGGIKPHPNNLKKAVNLMIIVSKIDPQTKRIDTENGNVEHTTGILNPETGLIYVKYGVINPAKATLEVSNKKTGLKELYRGFVEPKTGNIHLTEGVVSPKTGVVDKNLGQVIAIAPQDNPIVELTVITTRIDPNTNKLNIPNGEVERALGVFDLESGILDSKYGEINTKAGEVKMIDPRTNGVVTFKNSSFDPATGQVTIFGIMDPKTGRFNSSLGRLIVIGKQIDPVVEIAAISGKLDDKKGIIESDNAAFVTSIGQFDPQTRKINTKYGKIDLVKHTITYSDPESGKIKEKDIKVDSNTGQIMLQNEINPNTNKRDMAYGKIISLRIIKKRVDPSAMLPIERPLNNKDIVIDPKTNQIWIATPSSDSKYQLYTSSAIDPKTGFVATMYNYVDPKTGQVKKQSKIDLNQIQIEPQSGKIYSATGELDPHTGQLLYETTQVHPENDEIYTKVCKINPKTGKISLIKLIKTDNQGQTQEIDGLSPQVHYTQSPRDNSQRSGLLSNSETNLDKQELSPKMDEKENSLYGDGNLLPMTNNATDRGSGRGLFSNVFSEENNNQSKPLSLDKYVGTVGTPISPPIFADTNAKRVKKGVKIMAIVSNFDSNTKRIDTENGIVEHSIGTLDQETGLIETKYGVINPTKATLEVSNKKTGLKELYRGFVEPKTDNIHLTEGVVSPQTGMIDKNLGQVIAIAPQDNPIVELTVITTRIDPNTNNLDIPNGEFERALGVFDLESGILDSKYGEINTKTGEVKMIDARTNGIVTSKNSSFNPATGQVIIFGIMDPKTGRFNSSLGRLIVIGKQIDPVLEIAAISGKLDDKKGIIEPDNADFLTSTGQFDPWTRKINTKYGKIDLVKHTITYSDPESGKIKEKDIKVDSNTGQIMLQNEINPNTNKPDMAYGKILSLRIVKKRIDPSAMLPIERPLNNKDIVIDPKTNQIWIATPSSDSKYQLYTSSAIDPKTGFVATMYNYLDPKTGQVKKQSKVDPNQIQIEPESGKIYSASGELDPHTGEMLYETTQVHPENDEIYTKVCKINPKTGKISLIKLIKTDNQGQTQEIDGLNPKTHYTQSPWDNSQSTGLLPISETNLTKEELSPEMHEKLTIDKTLRKPEISKMVNNATDRGSGRGLFSNVFSGENNNQSKPLSLDKYVGTVGTPISPPFFATTTANRVKKGVKIMAIVSNFDSNTKRIDTENGNVEHSTGTLDQETGLIETKYGVINPTKATLEVSNKKTGLKELYSGFVEPKTGNIHLTEGVVSPQTGMIDKNLGQVIAIAPQDNPIVELTVITTRIDPNTNKLDIPNGEVERALGVFDLESGILESKYGEINTKTGEVKIIDPRTNGVVTFKNSSFDPATGQVTIFGIMDSKSGKFNQSVGRLLEFGQQIDPVVEIAAISGKLDDKGIIEPNNAAFLTSTGQFDPWTRNINTKYGKIDLVKQTIKYSDPESGKIKEKDIKVDSNTGQIMIQNEINPSTNKPDMAYGKILSLRIVKKRIDPSAMLPIERPLNNKDIVIDPKTNQIWIATPSSDSKYQLYTSSVIDAKTGFVSTMYNYQNLKTGEVKKQSKIDPNQIQIEPESGKIYSATGELDPHTGELLYETTQIDSEKGEIYTKIGKVDSKTGKIVLIKLMKTDANGKVHEIDPETCDFDMIRGRINKVFNKTIYVYNMVDPVTGEIIQVDPKDPKIIGARTTVTQTMTLSGEIDPITGRIITEYGHIDPNTGDIDPETAVEDPVTGKFILNYAQIDPSHFTANNENWFNNNNDEEGIFNPQSNDDIIDHDKALNEAIQAVLATNPHMKVEKVVM